MHQLGLFYQSADNGVSGIEELVHALRFPVGQKLLQSDIRERMFDRTAEKHCKGMVQI